MAERRAPDRQPVPDDAVDHRLDGAAVTPMIRFTAIRLIEIAAIAGADVVRHLCADRADAGRPDRPDAPGRPAHERGRRGAAQGGLRPRPAAARALSRLGADRRSPAISAIRGCSPRRCGRRLLPRLGNSLVLMGSSFVLALALALGLGTAAARRPDSRLDARDQPVLLCRRLDADLLARARADPGLRRRARLAAGERHRHGRRERPRRPAGASGAAGGDTDPGERRRLYPLCPRGDARGAGAGPYPHRPRQGRERGAGHPRIMRCAAR